MSNTQMDSLASVWYYLGCIKCETQLLDFLVLCIAPPLRVCQLARQRFLPKLHSRARSLPNQGRAIVKVHFMMAGLQRVLEVTAALHVMQKFILRVSTLRGRP